MDNNNALLERLEKVIDTLSDNSIKMGQMLAVHDEKLEKQDNPESGDQRSLTIRYFIGFVKSLPAREKHSEQSLLALLARLSIHYNVTIKVIKFSTNQCYKLQLHRNKNYQHRLCFHMKIASLNFKGKTSIEC